MTIYTDPEENEDYGFVFPPHGHRPPEIRYPRPRHHHRHHHPLVSTPLGMGPRGPKGDPFSFDDLTDEQLAELREDVASVYHRKLESVYTTTGENTSQIPIPWDDFDPEKDMLFVRIEGLWLHANEYTVSDGNIVLTTPITSAGTAVGITMITTVAMSVEDIEDLHGEDGFSPVVTMVRQNDGTLLSITDSDGTKSALIPDGAIGPTGQTGPVGPVGPQGPKGDKGDKGDVGPAGPKGQKGDKGDKGDAGLQGPKGDTGDQGPQGVTGPVGPQGEAGTDGISPTVSVQSITGGHEVTITDATGAHSFDVMDGGGGGGTDATTEAHVAQLWGNQLTKELTGEVLTAADAYAAPPMAFTVEGKSTQDGTPTPDAPVEIVSVEQQVTLHASADGTTDAANWPVLLNLTHALRSLPNGTHDTLSLTYLRPSTREGWAWYERVVERGVGIVTVSAFTSYVRRTRHGSNPGCVFGIAIDAPAVNVLGYCSHGVWVVGTTATENYGQFGNAWVTYNDPNLLKVTIAPDRSSLALGNEWLAENGPITFVYKLATPVTTTLDPIELPVLPAPDVTVWSDPSTGLTMRYVRDTNMAYAPVKLGFGYGHCTTAAATAAKAVAISGYTLNTGGIVSVLFDHDVPAGATLNVTSKGAKAIYHKGAAITDGIIKAGDTATFMYSTQYHLVSVDRAIIPDGSVTTAKLANGAVTNAKLATLAVGQENIKQNAVGYDQLADDAVGTDNMRYGAVTIDKISGNAKQELTSAILYATDATTAQTLAALGFTATVLTPQGAYSTVDAYGLTPQMSIRSMLCWIDTASGYLEKAPLGFSGNLQSQTITLWAKGLHSMASGILGVDTSWTVTALPTDADGVSY